jgi:hypothetical protein
MKLFKPKTNAILALFTIIFVFLINVFSGHNTFKEGIAFNVIFYSILYVISFAMMFLYDFILWLLNRNKTFRKIFDSLTESIGYFLVVQVGYRLTLLKNKIIRKKFDESVIPQGHYCYSVTEEELKRTQSPDWDGVYNIELCPYYKPMKGYNAACLYTDFIGLSFSLGDQCKICGKNIETKEDEE